MNVEVNPQKEVQDWFPVLYLSNPGWKKVYTCEAEERNYLMGQMWKGQSIVEQQPSAKIWWVWVKL